MDLANATANDLKTLEDIVKNTKEKIDHYLNIYLKAVQNVH